MKIAIDISQIIYGTGASRYTKELVISLLKLNSKHDFTLFGGSLTRKKELDQFTRHLKATSKTTYLSSKMMSLLWNDLHLVPIETFTGKLDLFHSSDWTQPPSKARSVTTVHDLSFFVNPSYVHPEVRQIHKKRLYWVAKECSQIIAVSKATKNDLIKYLDIDPARIQVIYEGPTIDSPPSNSPSITTPILTRYQLNKPYLIVPGCGHPRKNIKNIVEAFNKLKANYQLAIIGRPSKKEQALASDSVIFTGFVADSELPVLYGQAEALIYPSLYEGFGLPILDAFVCSTPVLTSKTSSLPEVAGDAAILCNPHSVESITAGIEQTLKYRPDLIKQGHLQLKNFSWEKTARETLRLYEYVVTNRDFKL